MYLPGFGFWGSVRDLATLVFFLFVALHTAYTTIGQAVFGHAMYGFCGIQVCQPTDHSGIAPLVVALRLALACRVGSGHRVQSEVACLLCIPCFQHAFTSSPHRLQPVYN